MATELPSKTPGEVKLVTFDFTNEAADGVTLSNPTITKSLLKGDDTNATALTVGTPAVTGMLVKVLIGGGTDKSKYKLRARVSADNSEVHDLDATLVVSEAAG